MTFNLTLGKVPSALHPHNATQEHLSLLDHFCLTSN